MPEKKKDAGRPRPLAERALALFGSAPLDRARLGDREAHGRGVDAGLAGPARALEGLVELAELVARPPLRVRVPARARRGRDDLALVRREFPDELDLGPQAVEGHEGVAHVL